MLKTRADFNSEDEYKAYTKTSDFLINYIWKGKSREEIIHDMALPDYEQKHLDKALEYCEKREEYTGIELDSHIVLLMNMNTPPVDIDLDEVVFIERE